MQLWDWKDGKNESTVVPPITAPPIPPLIFKSRLCFFLVIYMTPLPPFSNTAVFLPFPRAAVLGESTVQYSANSVQLTP